MTPDDPLLTPRERYHHGNLREALVQAGVELAREGGPDAVVVREASRRVGVSHNAAYRHFPSRAAFLSAVCDRSMTALADLMRALVGAVEGDGPAAAVDRLRATGRAYLRFAVEQPGLFRTAFALPTGMHYAPADGGPEDESELGPFGLLGRQLDGMVAAGALTAQRRAGADFVAWSAVHGLSMLLLEGPLRELPAGERERLVEMLLDTVQGGLTR